MSRARALVLSGGGFAGGAAPHLDAAVLERFPEGYRHLAYLQHGIGYPVKRDMPASSGPRSRRSTPTARRGSPAKSWPADDAVGSTRR